MFLLQTTVPMYIRLGLKTVLLGVSAHTCVGLLAEPFVFPAYIHPTRWKKSHFLQANKLPCLQVQRGAKPMGVWVVLQSLLNKSSGFQIDAEAVVRSSVLLAGVHPVKTALGAPVTHYRISLHDLAFRFPAPYATAKSRMVQATGSFRVPSSDREACFVSVPQPTCAAADTAMAS